MTTAPHDIAMDWAAALACQIPTMTRGALQAAWEAGTAHRAQLKTSAPEILRQLAGHVRDRSADLKARHPA